MGCFVEHALTFNLGLVLAILLVSDWQLLLSCNSHLNVGRKIVCKNILILYCKEKRQTTRSKVARSY